MCVCAGLISKKYFWLKIRYIKHGKTHRRRWLAQAALEQRTHSAMVARLKQRSSTQIASPFSCSFVRSCWGCVGGGGGDEFSFCRSQSHKRVHTPHTSQPDIKSSRHILKKTTHPWQLPAVALHHVVAPRIRLLLCIYYVCMEEWMDEGTDCLSMNIYIFVCINICLCTSRPPNIANHP